MFFYKILQAYSCFQVVCLCMCTCMCICMGASVRVCVRVTEVMDFLMRKEHFSGEMLLKNHLMSLKLVL